jgi:hypothetical protein
VGAADYFHLSLSSPSWRMNCLPYIISIGKHPSEEHRDNKEEAHLGLVFDLFCVCSVLILCHQLSVAQTN